MGSTAMTRSLLVGHLTNWHDAYPVPGTLDRVETRTLECLHDRLHDEGRLPANRQHRHAACRVPGCLGRLLPGAAPRPGRPSWYRCDIDTGHLCHASACVEPDGTTVCVCGMPTSTPNPKEDHLP